MTPPVDLPDGAFLEGVPDRRYFRTPATAPGPSGPRMATAFWEIRRDALGFLHRMRGEYGPIVQFPIPSPPTFLVSDPDAVRRVLVTHARNYDKQTLQYASMSLVAGQGILVTDGEIWRRQRRTVQPAFHREAIARIGDHVARALAGLLERWGDTTRGAVIDIDEAMMRVALEIVGASLFGSDLSGDADRLARATIHALDVVVARARVPLTPPGWLPTPANRRIARARAELDAAVEAIVADRRRDTEPRRDMLQMLLDAVDAPPHEVRDELVSFMVAGHETTASALMWALWFLAGDPQAMDQLCREADEVLGDRPVSYDDMDRLPFARAVFDEALRLYPPVWLVTRRAAEADVLGGRAVPAGSLLIMSPYLVHRDPSIWQRPDNFDPSRFLAGPAIAGPDAMQSFWPFGAGARMCIGKDFAYVEGVLLLAGLARHVRVERMPGARLPRASALVTLRPEGPLPLIVRARAAQPPRVT